MNMPDGFEKDYPYMNNIALAEKYGITKNQAAYLGKKNKLRKSDEFWIEARRLAGSRSPKIEREFVENRDDFRMISTGNHVRKEGNKTIHRMR